MGGGESIQGAGFARRLAAHLLVDLPLVMLILIPVLFVLLLRVHGLEAMATPGAVEPPWWWNAILNAVLVVAVVALWKFTQATPGKKVFRLKIVDAKTGEAASTGRLWLRAIGYFVASLPFIPVKLTLMGQTETTWLPLGAGFFWILVDRKNRGWHDLLSGTVTVAASRGEEVEAEPERTD